MDVIPPATIGGLRFVDELGNMITMMSKSIGQYSSLEVLFLEAQRYGNRRRAIQWMKGVSQSFYLS